MKPFGNAGPKRRDAQVTVDQYGIYSFYLSDQLLPLDGDPDARASFGFCRRSRSPQAACAARPNPRMPLLSASSRLSLLLRRPCKPCNGL